MRALIALIIILSANLPLAVAGQLQKISQIDQPAVAHQPNQALSSPTSLNQPPNQSNGIFSDEACSLCSSGQQVLAENFTVVSDDPNLFLEQITLWGGYYSSDTPLDPDDFDILIHSDSSGSPGAVICTETGITPASRTTTGVISYLVSMNTSSPSTSPPPAGSQRELTGSRSTTTLDRVPMTGSGKQAILMHQTALKETPGPLRRREAHG